MDKDIHLLMFNHDIVKSAFAGVSAKEMLEKTSDFIRKAKERGDTISQMHGCLAESVIETHSGNKELMFNSLLKLGSHNEAFLLSNEFGVEYHHPTHMVHTDLYGLYYAVHDHCTKNSENYKPLKNGVCGNPTVTQFFDVFTRDNSGNSVFISDGTMLQDINYRSPSHQRQNLIRSMERNEVKLFPDLSVLTFGGGGGPSEKYYSDLIRDLKPQFGSLENYNPKYGGKKFDLDMANDMAAKKSRVDYVVSMNVINEFEGRNKPADAAQLLAATAVALKEGGKAIHLIEKNTIQDHLNVNLNKSLHGLIGEKLIYSFHRDFSNWDDQIDRLGFITKLTSGSDNESKIKLKKIQEITVSDKPDDFRTAMMVLRQEKEVDLRKEDIDKFSERFNKYRGRFNYYTKQVYDDTLGR